MFCSVFFTRGCHFGPDPLLWHQMSLSDWFSRPGAVVGEFPGVNERFRLGVESRPFPQEHPTSHTMTFGAVNKDEA
jgi:hypothetical protein